MKRFPRVRLILSILLLTPAQGALAAAAGDPAFGLLSSFSRGCGSYGRFSAQALAQSETLRGLADDLRKQPACQAISGALDGVVSSTALLGRVLGQEGIEVEIANLEGDLEQLQMAYFNEKEAALKTQYATSVALTSVTLAGLRTDVKSYRRRTLLQGVQGFSQYSNRLFAALESDRLCMGEDTGTKAAIAAQVVSQGSQLLSLPLGLAAFTIGNSLNQFVGYLRGLKYADSTTRINEAVIGEGVACALETIANTYCSARDAAGVVRAQALLTPQRRAENERAWPGLLLLERDSQGFDSWVERVVAGAPPTSEASSREKAQGDLMRVNLSIAADAFRGVLAEHERRLAGLPPGEAQARIVIRSLIVKLIQTMSSRVAKVDSTSIVSVLGGSIPQESPFFQVFQYDALCGPESFLMTGVFAPVTTVAGRCPPFPDAALPTIAQIAERVDRLVDQAMPVVSGISDRVLETNGRAVLAQWERGLPGRPNGNEFFSRVESYLASLRSTFGAEIPESTRSAIDAIGELMGRVKAILASADDPGIRLQKLRDLLAPRQDLAYFRKYLEQIVKWEVWYRLESGKLDDALTAILELSTVDSLAALRSEGVLSTVNDLGDIETAQVFSAENLMEVLALYQAPLTSRLERLKDPNHRKIVGTQHWARLCTSLALVPPEPSSRRFGRRGGRVDFEKVARLCQGAVKTFETRGAEGQTTELSLAFDAINALPLEKSDERICSLYDFRRKALRYDLRK